MEKWLEVVQPYVGEPPVDKNTGLAMPVLEVAPVVALGDVGSPTEQTVAMHPSYLSGINWSLENGHRAFIAMASERLEQEMVLFTLVRSPDGGYFFGGECGNISLTEPIGGLLGGETTSTLDRFVGMTDAGAIDELFLGSSPSPPPQPTILNPQDAPPELLETLTSVVLLVRIPADWVGPFTICSRIEEGWSDCLDISEGQRDEVEIGAYIGGSQRLEFWLLDEHAEVRVPVELLGMVQLDKPPTPGERLIVTMMGRFTGEATQPVENPGVLVESDV